MKRTLARSGDRGVRAAAYIDQPGNIPGAGGVAPTMTGLGAALYIGFFALAALWLYVSGRAEDQPQRPDEANSSNTAVKADGFSPWLASHSLSK